jgi:hypothetical protein
MRRKCCERDGDSKLASNGARRDPRSEDCPEFFASSSIISHISLAYHAGLGATMQRRPVMGCEASIYNGRNYPAADGLRGGLRGAWKRAIVGRIFCRFRSTPSVGNRTGRISDRQEGVRIYSNGRDDFCQPYLFGCPWRMAGSTWNWRADSR